MSATEQLSIVLGLNYSPFISGLGNVEKQLTGFGKSVAGIGSMIFNKWTALAAIGALAKMTKDAADLEYQLARVSAITGATGGELSMLGDAALEAGKRVGTSVVEIAGGMAALGQAGFSANEVMAAMPAVLDLAAVGSLSFAQASDSMAVAIRTFSLEAKDATKVASYYAYLQSTTPTTIMQVGDAMKYVAPIAEMAGWKIDEVAAAIGLLAQKGIRGTMAGTGLRGMLSTLLDPTDKAAKLFKMLGIELKNDDGSMKSLTGIVDEFRRVQFGASEAAQVFQQRQLASFSVLMQMGPEALRTAQKALHDNENYVQAAAEKLYNTLTKSFGRTRAHLLGVSVAIVSNFEGPLRKIMDNVLPMWFDAMEHWFNNNDKLKSDFAALFDWMTRWGEGLATYVAQNVDTWYENLRWLAKAGTDAFVKYVMGGLNIINQIFGGSDMKEPVDWFEAMGEWARSFYDISKGILSLSWEVLTSTISAAASAFGVMVSSVIDGGDMFGAPIEGAIEWGRQIYALSGRINDTLLASLTGFIEKHKQGIGEFLGLSPEQITKVIVALGDVREIMRDGYSNIDRDIVAIQDKIAGQVTAVVKKTAENLVMDIGELLYNGLGSILDGFYELFAEDRSFSLFLDKWKRSVSEFTDYVYDALLSETDEFVVFFDRWSKGVQDFVDSASDSILEQHDSFLKFIDGWLAGIDNFVTSAKNLHKSLFKYLDDSVKGLSIGVDILGMILPSVDTIKERLGAFMTGVKNELKSALNAIQSDTGGFSLMSVLMGGGADSSSSTATYLSGATKAMRAWAEGLYTGIRDTGPKLDAIIQSEIGDRLIGQSPPPKGPLNRLGIGGYKAMAAWWDKGGRVAMEEVGGELETVTDRFSQLMQGALTVDNQLQMENLQYSKENLIAYFGELQQVATDYQTAFTATLGEWLLQQQTADQAWAQTTLNSFMTIQDGLSDTVMAFVTGGQSIGAIWQNLAKQILTSMVKTFIQLQIQELMNSIFQRQLRKAQAKAELKLAAETAKANTFARSSAYMPTPIAMANAEAARGYVMSGIVGIEGLDMGSPAMPTAQPAAEGGIVKRPTLILAGEAGPEKFVPLDDPTYGGGGSNVTVYLTVEGAVDDETAIKIANALSRVVERRDVRLLASDARVAEQVEGQ